MSDLLTYSVDDLVYQIQIMNKLIFLILVTLAIPKIITLVRKLFKK